MPERRRPAPKRFRQAHGGQPGGPWSPPPLLPFFFLFFPRRSNEEVIRLGKSTSTTSCTTHPLFPPFSSFPAQRRVGNRTRTVVDKVVAPSSPFFPPPPGSTGEVNRWSFPLNHVRPSSFFLPFATCPAGFLIFQSQGRHAGRGNWRGAPPPPPPPQDRDEIHAVRVSKVRRCGHPFSFPLPSPPFQGHKSIEEVTETCRF